MDGTCYILIIGQWGSSFVASSVRHLGYIVRCKSGKYSKYRHFLVNNDTNSNEDDNNDNKNNKNNSNNDVGDDQDNDNDDDDDNNNN